jgi:hypothetical protein
MFKCHGGACTLEFPTQVQLKSEFVLTSRVLLCAQASSSTAADPGKQAPSKKRAFKSASDEVPVKTFVCIMSNHARLNSHCHKQYTYQITDLTRIALFVSVQIECVVCV